MLARYRTCPNIADTGWVSFPVLPFIIALIGSIGCQDDMSVPNPEVSGITPDHQIEGEPTRVRVIGQSFLSKHRRNMSKGDEFHTDADFVVRLFDAEGTTDQFFELEKMTKNGNDELIGTTPADLPPGLYSVIVDSPFEMSSTPLEAAYTVYPLEIGDSTGDSGSGDTGTSDTSITGDAGSDTDSQSDTDVDVETDIDTDAETDSESVTETDTGTASGTGTPGTDTVSAGDSETASDTDVGGDTATDTGTGSDDTGDDTDTAADTGTGSADATCDDGVQNRDETGIDCGGDRCPPCPCSSWRYSPPERITGLGLFTNIYSPSLSAGGLTMYFSGSVGTGDIYVATRDDRGTLFNPAAKVQTISTDTTGESTPYITANGLSLYFQSNRSGSIGGRDIMVATRPTTAAGFTEVGFVSEVNSAQNDHLPWVSADELTLLFVSNRFTPFAQDANIWMATRGSVDEPFGALVLLPGVNTNEEQGRAAMADDALTLYFTSESPGATVDLDIWVTTRPDAGSDFGSAVNLSDMEAGFNTTADERDVTITQDGTELFFASGRRTQSEIYRSLRECADEDTTPF